MLLKVLTGKLSFKSLRPLNLETCSKRDIREYFENSYDLNESLFTALNDDSVFYKCPDRLRLPLIFYYCHTAVVYVNKLMLAGLLEERVHLKFEEMFETGVDEMSWDDTENYRMGGSYQWPSVEEVVEYRRNVRNIILQLIEDLPLELPITMESPWWALLMGMEHERIHLETSSVLIRQLPVSMVTKPEGWSYGPLTSNQEVTCNPMISVDEQDVCFGKPFDFPSYGWDNEYGNVWIRVPKFAASKYLITNREFLEFIEDGGYDRRDLWTEEGWEWKCYRQSSHPTFWICDQGCKSGCGADLSDYSHCQFSDSDEVSQSEECAKFRYRAMFDVLELPLAWPVDVNYHEAKAFCTWKGPEYRIMTEAEHNIIRGNMRDTKEGVECDIIYQDRMNANTNLTYGSSTPVNMYPASDKGFHDAYGNVWEWTEDHFNGLESFTHFLYDDFSSPCYDGRHNLILGGSWISTGDEASRFARFGFRRHFMQHCGFRVSYSLTDDSKVNLPARHIDIDLYVAGLGKQEIPETLDPQKYDVVHVKSTNGQYYLDSEEALEGILEQEFGFRDSFARTIAYLCQSYCQIYKCGTEKAIWLGAGVGKGPFELANTFEHIIGADFGGLFIEAAKKLQNGECLQYKAKGGELILAAHDNLDHADRITFKQFTWIPNEVGKSDLAVVAFLDRASNPKAWLARLWDIINENGLVVIASRLGKWDLETLHPYIGNKLRCICVQEVPFESQDKDSSAKVTVWVRNLQ